MLSELRTKQLERLLRRIRGDARLFEDDDTAARLSHLIKRIKARLEPGWDAAARARRDDQFKRDYEIDIAINTGGR